MAAFSTSKSIAARLVLALLVLSWSQVFAQPCVMADNAGTVVAAVASQANHHPQADHHSHEPRADGLVPASDCGHCPPDGVAGNPACDDALAAACEVRPDLALDLRSKNPDLKDAVHLALAPAQPSVPLPHPQNRFFCPDTGQLRFATGPSIAVRFCVYLK